MPAARDTIDKLYVNEREAARMLGHDVAWLRENARSLEEQFGFPKIDVAIGRRHREAIEEWSRERNIARGRRPGLTETNRENRNAL